VDRACNCSIGTLRQEYYVFEASLGCIVRPCLKKKKELKS
jgi:hypothetical protein